MVSYYYWNFHLKNKQTKRKKQTKKSKFPEFLVAACTVKFKGLKMYCKNQSIINIGS